MKKILFLFILHFTQSFFLSADTKDSLFVLLKDIPDTSEKIHSLNKWAFDYRITNPELSINLLKNAIKLSNQSKDTTGLARSYHSLGTIYYFQANYPDALDYFLKSLKIREFIKDSINIAKGYNNVALIHFEQDNLEQSLLYHQKSIDIKLKLNDKAGLASSYGNIGNIYFKEAKKLSENIDTKTQADSLFGASLNQHLKAQFLQEEVIREKPDLNTILFGLSGTYNNIGNVFFERALLGFSRDEYLKDALNYHLRALKIQDAIEDLRGASHSYINIAGIYEKTKKHQEALNNYQKALQLIGDLDLKESKKAIYQGLSNMYEVLGDKGNALSFYKKYVAIKDSIIDDVKHQQIAEMQALYDSEKKEQEILLLNKNQKIKETELEREKILKRSFSIGLALAALLGVCVFIILIVVWNRYKLKNTISKKLEEQNLIIALKNKEVTDSIKYAKRIQEAILPPDVLMQKMFPEHFVLYKPKDIVSGDFYWAEQFGNKYFLATVDCTGHGVPGAFMSIVGNNLLNQAVNLYGIDKPSLILDNVNKELYKILHQTYEESAVKDGMDLSLIAINPKTLIMEYAGAYNPVWILRNEKIIELKGDKFPVGAFVGEDLKHFTQIEFQLQKGDFVYLFTDGYADQFGGEKGKKFKYRQLENKLLEIHKQTVSFQREILENTFENWKGNLEQVDDVCLIGVRI
jgi:serine phosphatase RsbU (regulator of sigma subunit)